MNDGLALLTWYAAAFHRGVSAEYMARHLARAAGLVPDDWAPCGWDYASPWPRDAGDFGRCVALLDAVPCLRPHVGRMAAHGREWAALAAAWDELESLYRAESLFGAGSFRWSRPKCNARLREILEAAG